MDESKGDQGKLAEVSMEFPTCTYVRKEKLVSEDADGGSGVDAPNDMKRKEKYLNTIY